MNPETANEWDPLASVWDFGRYESRLSLDLIPRVPSFRVPLKIRQSRAEFRLQLGRNLNRVGKGSDALPDHFDKVDSLLNRQFKNVGDGYMGHGV